MHIAQLPRTGPASSWFNWWSRDLLDWANGRGYTSITNKASYVSRIVELDVATGGVVRTAITLPGRVGLIAVSPDGEFLFLRSYAGPQGARAISVVTTRRSRLVCTLPSADIGPRGRYLLEGLAGFSDDGQTVYVVLFDKAREKTQLVGWSLGTWRPQLVLEVEASVRHRGDGRVGRGARSLCYLNGSNGLLVDRPGPFVVIAQGVDTTTLIRDLRRGGKVIRSLPWVSSETPMLSADRRRLFARDAGLPGGIRSWDLQSGDELPSFTGAPQDYSPRYGATYDPQRERLFVAFCQRDAACFTGVVLVGNAREHSWVDHLSYSGTAVPGQPHFLRLSPDGRTLATICARRKNKSTQLSGSELLLWDLSILDGDLGADRPTEPGADDQQ